MANENNKTVVIVGAALAAIALIGLFVLLVLVFAFLPASGGFGGEIGVIPIKGTIANEQDSFSDTLSAIEVVDKLDEASRDPNVKVIFLDIDSGGGSIVATKQIVAKIRATDKPVVAYIGEVGASGAYYVAAASDYVIADADSITGSIGVIWVALHINELMEDFGIKATVMKKGTYKDMGSIFREMTDDEKVLLQELIDESFEQFRGDVLAFRKDKGLTEMELDAVADGRILSGRQALSINLVDELSSREDAIRKAAEIGGIEGEPYLKIYEKPELTLADIFFSAGQSFGKGMSSSLSISAQESVPSIKT